MQPDLRAECLAMAGEIEHWDLAAADLLRRVADALPQEPKTIFVPPKTREEAIQHMRDDGDADPEGTARLNYPDLFIDAQEPKGDVVEAVVKALWPFTYGGGELDAARAALSAAEPFIQARIREAVEAELHAALKVPGPTCVACEDSPKAPNDPCAVCGKSSAAEE